MKKSFFLLILISLSFSSFSQSSRSDSVNYQILSDNNKLYIEIPFGIGSTGSSACYPSPYGDPRHGSTYFGVNAKYYLDNQLRLDLAYKASFVGTDDFEYMEYNTELQLKANYPILTSQHRWGELIFLNPIEYFFAGTPKYRYLNAHGGYYRFHQENKLFLGLNYTTRSYLKVEIPELHRKKTSFDYFELGAEILFRVAKSEEVLFYYDFMNEKPGKIGWNAYIVYTYGYMLAKLEIGGHNYPILKFTAGFIIPG